MQIAPCRPHLTAESAAATPFDQVPLQPCLRVDDHGLRGTGGGTLAAIGAVYEIDPGNQMGEGGRGWNRPARLASSQMRRRASGSSLAMLRAPRCDVWIASIGYPLHYTWIGRTRQGQRCGSRGIRRRRQVQVWGRGNAGQLPEIPLALSLPLCYNFPVDGCQPKAMRLRQEERGNDGSGFEAEISGAVGGLFPGR